MATLTQEQYDKTKALAASGNTAAIALLKSNPTVVGGTTMIGPQKDTNPSNPLASNSGMSAEQIKAVTDRVAATTDSPDVAAKAAALQKNNYVLPSQQSSAGMTLPSPTDTTGNTLTDATENLLPQAENRSSLVEFADMLNQATTLARNRRQASELGILEDYGFKPGQVAAGTMGQILGLLQQRTDTSYGALQDAAMQAYQNEEERKATDLANKQQLALSLVTKGVDSTVIEGLLNAPDFNSALSMAAGALKGSGDYTDVRTAEVDGKLMFFGVKEDGTVDQLAEFGSGATGGIDFTDAQKLKLEAAGLGSAPRDQQLAYLYPPEGEDKAVLLKQEFADAEAFADQFDGSPEDLERALRADAQYMTDGDITSVVNKYRTKQEASKREQDVKYNFAFDLIESNFNPAMLQTRDGELADAKRDSLNDIDSIDLKDYFDLKDDLTPEEERTLKQQVGKATIKKNTDGTFTITIDGESRTYKVSSSNSITQI